jgi:hypothetical protein
MLHRNLMATLFVLYYGELHVYLVDVKILSRTSQDVHKHQYNSVNRVH